MRQRLFEERNASRWAEFEALVAALDGGRRARRGVRDAASLPRRYREVCRDLAIATERRYSPRLVDRLNRLSLEGHRLLYGHDVPLAGNVVRFFARGFPAAVRRDAGAVLLATLLFLGPALLIWALVRLHPELVYSVIPPEQVRAFEGMYDPAAEHVGSDRGAASDLQMFGYYVFNNVSIAFRAYAGGLLLCLGSAVVLLFNGLMLGAVAAHIDALGFHETFYSFVIGHGAFELTAIVLSGAAGLRLGWSVVAPGASTRLASLRRAARETMALVWGVFAMLLLAAVVEAFWSSRGSLAPELKLAVGAVLWALVLLYFSLLGRSAASAEAPRVR